ncbi:hypothetical protein BCR35DRAFT_94636 [Leucosporidium creatinivorum]|uniref:Uncharacterized protein n=1 Tax=Leucosporidium creatinivorum TaxID=106004 RepID=A0A1Y2F7C3_9BASI|nr:hypothetical protein BCR35DRAFT_94636 [Leucosporidium creatinivorum]
MFNACSNISDEIAATRKCLNSPLQLLVTLSSSSSRTIHPVNLADAPPSGSSLSSSSCGRAIGIPIPCASGMTSSLNALAWPSPPPCLVERRGTILRATKMVMQPSSRKGRSDSAPKRAGPWSVSRQPR